MSTRSTQEGGAPPPPSIYQTSWQDAAGGGWQKGLDLSLGFEWDSQGVPQPIVQLMEQDVTQYSALTVDEQRCLVIAIDLGAIGDSICVMAPALYLKCTATLSADGETFNGGIGQVCAGAVRYGWQGRCQPPPGAWRHAMSNFVEFVTSARAIDAWR